MERFENELIRLQAEYCKGIIEINKLTTQIDTAKNNLSKIEGSINTLSYLLREGGVKNSKKDI